MTDSNSILLLVPGFPADERDSSCLPAIQSYVEALVERWPTKSINVVAFHYPFERRTYRWRGVCVHALSGRNKRSAKLQTWWRALQTGRQLMAGRCGTIHSFWLGECAVIGSFLARQRGWIHVVSVGGQEVRRHTVYTILLRHAAFTLTAGSIPAALDARRVLRRTVDAIIPLGIDADRINAQTSGLQKSAAWRRDSHWPPHRSNPTSHDSSVPSRPIDVLAVGSLIPIKRVHDVVDVASRLVEDRKDLTVVVVGEGPERSILEARIRNRRLGNNVKLRGMLPREEVLGLMRRSKILLHASEYESQGYVFLEALSSGMYVICRNVGFQPDSANVCHAETIEEMVAAAARRLSCSHAPESVEVPTADGTVDAFSEYYAGAPCVPSRSR